MKKNKLRYAILKEIDEGNISFTENEFGVSRDEFDEAVRFLHRERYIDGIRYGDNRPIIAAPYATEKGERYLSENSVFGKAYKGLKEVKSWIK